MNWKLSVLEKIVEWLVGGDLFEFIKDAVAIANNEDMTSEEKRQAVFTEAKKVFSDVATILVNLAIEVAVLLLKAKLGELENGN